MVLENSFNGRRRFLRRLKNKKFKTIKFTIFISSEMGKLTFFSGLQELNFEGGG